MRLNRELAELSVPDDTHRDIKRAGDVIFKYATRDDATELDKTWKDWLMTHSRVVKIHNQSDTLAEMQKSAR
eukprot:3744063-Rhodomonas_salina.1